MRAIYVQKIGMTRVFDEDGRAIPISVVKVEPNIVSQVKTIEKDGYSGLQVATGSRRRINKPQTGHFKKINAKPTKVFEIRTDEAKSVGDKIEIDIFAPGDKVCATGISKGKGFAGTVKRHHFHLGPKTHGSNNYRQPGSIGSAFPERVTKGKRMSGHLGARQATVKNLEIVKVDTENSQLLIKGALPGANRSYVKIWSRLPAQAAKEHKDEA